jgi:hypothetical protein
MLQRIGGTTLAVLAVGFGIYTFTTSWPWWVTAIFAFVAAVSTVFALLPAKKEDAEPAHPSVETKTFAGSLDGSKIDNVWSDADILADGSARNAEISNITHRTDRKK